jgi:hypothetical protein
VTSTHPLVLDGGAAAGQESRVLFMKFCQQDGFVLAVSHPWLLSLSIWLADCLYILESVEYCVTSAGGQKHWPQKSM